MTVLGEAELAGQALHVGTGDELFAAELQGMARRGELSLADEAVDDLARDAKNGSRLTDVHVFLHKNIVAHAQLRGALTPVRGIGKMGYRNVRTKGNAMPRWGDAKAIETTYNGFKFRSRLEARWAVFFDALDVKYEYEPEGFDLDGVRYLPDFWLPELDCWVEVKPRDPDEEEERKALLLAKHTEKSVYVMVGLPRDVAYEDITDGGVRVYAPGVPKEATPVDGYRWVVCPWCGKADVALSIVVNRCGCIDRALPMIRTLGEFMGSFATSPVDYNELLAAIINALLAIPWHLRFGQRPYTSTGSAVDKAKEARFGR